MRLLVSDLVIAGRSLLQHKKRTLFLGGAITAVTALLVLLLGLSAGVRQTMVESATIMSTGHVNVAGFFKVTSGQSAPVVTHYKKALELARASAPEIQYAVARGRGWGKVVSETGSAQMGINGVDIATEPGFRDVVKLVEGKLDDLAQPNTILIFQEHAKKLGVGVGDVLTISTSTPRGVANTADVRVIGVARDVGLISAWNVYVPTVSLNKLYQLNDETTGGVYLYLKDPEQSAPVAARLREAFGKAGYRMMDPDKRPFWEKFEKVNREEWTGQKIDITTWEDETAWMSFSLAIMNALTVVLISVLLVIVVVGIMNTMWIAIRERTREIGTLRAIGMYRGGVLRMFLTEALLLGAAATAAGAILGALGAGVVNAAQIGVPLSVQLFLMSDRLVLSVDPGSALTSAIAITVVTGLAALYPSMRAARLKPVTAMHHIG
jgi:ABC-type lipoprotein release transport system permease subunit